jgi:hypothetical protein
MEIRKEEEYFLFFYHSFPIFYCCSYDSFMLELITRALWNRKKRETFLLSLNARSQPKL